VSSEDDPTVSMDEHHVALPKLYGAPAYARPPRAVATTDRPIHPDDLPIAAEQSDEERELAERLLANPYGSFRSEAGPVGDDRRQLRPRPFTLRALSRLARR
jgi:hypothetical protein